MEDVRTREDLESANEALKEEVEELRANVAYLESQIENGLSEGLKANYEMEIEELRHELAKAHEENGGLRADLYDMALDMGGLEAKIEELMERLGE